MHHSGRPKHIHPLVHTSTMQASLGGAGLGARLITHAHSSSHALAPALDRCYKKASATQDDDRKISVIPKSGVAQK